MFISLKKLTAFYLLGFLILVPVVQAEKVIDFTDTRMQQIMITLKNKPIIVVSVEPLYEIISSLSHGIAKPEVIYLQINEVHKTLSD